MNFNVYFSRPNKLQDETNICFPENIQFNDKNIVHADEYFRTRDYIMCYIVSSGGSNFLINAGCQFKESNCLFQDFDDHTTIKEFKDLMKDVCYVLITSRNHQKEKIKDDKIYPAKDRFHVLYPLNNKITNKETYEKYLDKAIDSLNSDKSCSNFNRKFFGSGTENPNFEFFYNPGTIDIIEYLDKNPLIKKITTGDRHASLKDVVVNQWRNQAITNEQELLSFALDFNNKYCNPSKPESEVQKIVEWVITRVKNDYSFSDQGDAKRLVDYFDGDIIYCDTMKSWLYYDKGVWLRDDKLLVENKYKEAVRYYYRQASDIMDSKERKRLTDHLFTMEFSNRKSAILRELKSDIPISYHDFDKADYLFNTVNGTINLHTGAFYDHIKDELHTKQSPVNYENTVTCPKWLSFLDEIFEGNQELIDYLQLVFGRCLSADTSEQEFYLCYGVGRNGKSTLFEVLNHILGNYSVNTSPDNLMSKYSNDTSFLARLRGARMVIANESGAGTYLNDALVKQLTSGEPLEAREKYSNPIEFRPVCKLFMISNHKPNILDDSFGMWRRIRLIEFKHIIPENKINKNLKKELIQEEASGILRWLVNGYQKWKKEGLKVPECVLLSTKQYQASEDIIGQFLQEQNIIKLDNNTTRKDDCPLSSAIYKTYAEWAKNNGLKLLSNKIFSLKLQERGFQRYHAAKGTVWLNMDFQSDF